MGVGFLRSKPGGGKSNVFDVQNILLAAEVVKTNFTTSGTISGYAIDGNGHLVRMGGNINTTSSINAVEVRNKDTDVITAINTLSNYCGGMGSTTDGNGDVVRACGANGSNAASQYLAVEKFNKDTGVRNYIGDASSGGQSTRATTDGNGDVVVAGGYNSDAVAKFNKDTGVKTVMPVLASKARQFVFIKDFYGHALRAAGKADGSTYYNVVEKFDKDTGVKTTLAAVFAGGMGAAGCLFDNGDIFLGGGNTGSNQKNAYRVDKNTGVRTTLTSMVNGGSKSWAAKDRFSHIIATGMGSAERYDSNTFAKSLIGTYNTSGIVEGLFLDGNQVLVGGSDIGVNNNIALAQYSEVIIPAYCSYKLPISGTEGVTGATAQTIQVLFPQKVTIKQLGTTAII